MSALLPLPPLAIPGWRITSAEVAAHSCSVRIDTNQIPELLEWLNPGPPNKTWQSYVTPLDPIEPDLPGLFFELALTVSQFGGFVAHSSEGNVLTWKKDGSGVKAILATMHAIRAERKLPQIDIKHHIERELAHFFIRTPFGKERLDMLLEIGQSRSPAFFRHTLQTARRQDGSYRFNSLHMQGLACRFPLSFGEDPVFYKKASLLLMTMEIALNQLGHKAIAETLPPADYRIPQILEGLGILQFSDELSAKVTRGHIFRIDDPQVLAIRAMTVEAVGMIKSAYEKQRSRTITCAELDGLLYLLSRNRPLMNRATMKPHMLVATHAF